MQYIPEDYSVTHPEFYAAFCDFLNGIEKLQATSEGLRYFDGFRFKPEPPADRKQLAGTQSEPPPVRRRTRKPSIAAELRAARRAGAISATVTRPDGVAVSATFGTPAAEGQGAPDEVEAWFSRQPGTSNAH